MALVAQPARLGRDGVVFEIQGLCRGQGRGSCYNGALRNRLGLQGSLRARIFAPTLRQGDQFGELLSKRVLDELRVRGLEGVLGG